MFSPKHISRPSLTGVHLVKSKHPVYRQLQAFTAAPCAFTNLAAPHNKNSPLSRSAQIACHFSSSSPNNSPTNTTANMSSQYKVRKIGAPNTLEHRIFIEKDGVPVSPFHDIPLYANEQQTVLNMVVEIPRWTNGKLEVSSILLLFFELCWNLFAIPVPRTSTVAPHFTARITNHSLSMHYILTDVLSSI
jgi:hypothetical protein